MATFGYYNGGTPGVSSYSAYPSVHNETDVASDTGGSGFTLSEAATLSTLSIYLKAHNANTLKFKGIIYTDNASYPDALAAVGSESAYVSTTAGWVDSTITGSLSAADYWLGLIKDNVGSSAGDWYFDTATGAAGLYKTGTTYTAPSDPYPAGAGTIGTRLFSVYVTYTPGGGGGTTLDLAAASFGFTPEDTTLTGTLGLSNASLNFTGNDVTPKLTLHLGNASWGFTPESVTIVGGTAIALAAAVFGFTGESVTILGATLIALGVASLGFTGNTVKPVGTVNLASAAWGWAAESITLIKNTMLELGAASWKFAGKSVTLVATGYSRIAAMLFRWRRHGRR